MVLLCVCLSVSKGAEWFNWEAVFLSSNFSAVCCVIVFFPAPYGVMARVAVTLSKGKLFTAFDRWYEEEIYFLSEPVLLAILLLLV